MRDDNLNLSKVNRICDEFDSICQAGTRDEVNAFLVTSLKDSPAPIAVGLIEVDIEYRLRKGETPTASDYERFGAREAEIAEKVLQSSSPPPRSRELIQDDFSNSTNGQFQLVRQLGEGGMGNVWLANQNFPVKRQVAIKVLRDEVESSETTSRFLTERQLLAMLSHPHIAKIHDGGETNDGRHYLVMEFVEGEPITEFCLEKKLEIPEVLQLMILVCRALHHAHEKQLVHRDIKPANVLVSTTNGIPSPVLIDFGLAKCHFDDPGALKRDVTESGKLIGTLNYMSPEQAGLNNHSVDSRSDIYSMGVLLYQLLTGSTPLETDSIREQGLLKTLESINSVEPELPSRRSERGHEPFRNWHRKISGELDWIIVKALEKLPDERYPTIALLADDLENYLQQKPVTARKPTVAYKSKKFFLRHRVPTLVAAVGFVACIIAGGFAWKFSRNADDATNTATKTKAEKLLNEVRLTQQVHQTNMVKNDLAFANYFSQINAASLSVEKGDLDVAKSQLANSPQLQRGWEYFYLLNKAAGQGDEFVAKGKSATPPVQQLDCLARSPNQRMIAVDSEDHFQIVDPDTNQTVVEYQVNEPVTSAVFTSNSQALYAITSSGKLVQLDCSTTEVFEIAELGFAPTTIKLSSTDKRIFAVVENEIFVLNSKNGRCLIKLRGHNNPVVRISVANQKLSSIDESGRLRLWDGSRRTHHGLNE